MRVAQALSAGLPGHPSRCCCGEAALRAALGRRGACQGLPPWVDDRNVADDHAAAKRPDAGGGGAVPAPPGLAARDPRMGEAELGRLSMIAVHHDVNPSASSPEITYGDGQLGLPLDGRGAARAARSDRRCPDRWLTGEVALGRESLEAILHEGKPSADVVAGGGIRIDLVSMPDLDLRGSLSGEPPAWPGSRATMPWVEAASTTPSARPKRPCLTRGTRCPPG